MRADPHFEVAPHEVEGFDSQAAFLETSSKGPFPGRQAFLSFSAQIGDESRICLYITVYSSWLASADSSFGEEKH